MKLSNLPVFIRDVFHKVISRSLMRKKSRRLSKNGVGFSLRATLQGYGCSPRTVFDIGVGRGTQELYETYPNSRHVLIDPVASCVDLVGPFMVGKKWDFVESAVGARPGELDFFVDSGDIEKSSLLARSNLTYRDVELNQRRVTVRTLDDIARDLKCEPPFVVKIDTEGFELEVIRGASNTLAQTKLLIAEVSVAKRFENSYSFVSLVTAVQEAGLVFSDFAGLRRNKGGKAGLRRIDMVFIPEATTADNSGQ